MCTFRDTINRSINSQVWDRRPTATNDDHHRGRFVDSWEFVSAPPVSSLHLHISREYLLRLRNSGIRRANHRHVPTIHENIGPGADVYFAARWKTPGIRPINLRSWNWFAGFNHRELFLTGVALSFPRLVSSRLVSSRFLLGLARDHPLTILGIFLAPLCREFDVATGDRYGTDIYSMRSRCNRRFERFLSQNGGSSRILGISRVCLRTVRRLWMQRLTRMNILREIIMGERCGGLRRCEK